jgi:hypothetical protein
MIAAKFHKTGFEIILAACDSDLLGKTLVERDMRMVLDSSFFGDELVSEDEFKGMLANATSANLVGEKAVGAAIESGYVLQDAVARISGTPYAMFFCMG